MRPPGLLPFVPPISVGGGGNKYLPLVIEHRAELASRRGWLEVMTPERLSAPVVDGVGRNGCLIRKRNEVGARETFVAGLKRDHTFSPPSSAY